MNASNGRLQQAGGARPEDGVWAIGGKSLKAEDVHALGSGKAA